MLQGLFGLQPGSRLSRTRLTGLATVCLCLLFAAGAPARSQEAAAAPDSATSPYTTFDAPGAGADEFQGTAAIAINAAGSVVGVYVDTSGLIHGYVRTSSGVFTSFEAKDAGTGASQGTIPTSINASGVIAGTYLNGKNVSHGFVRAADGTITEFDAPGASTATNRGTAAMSIDDAGTITGFYTTGSYLTASLYHGFVRAANGAITAVDAPDAGAGAGFTDKLGTMAYAINAAGIVAGSLPRCQQRAAQFPPLGRRGVHGVRPAGGGRYVHGPARP